MSDCWEEPSLLSIDWILATILCASILGLRGNGRTMTITCILASGHDGSAGSMRRRSFTRNLVNRLMTMSYEITPSPITTVPHGVRMTKMQIHLTPMRLLFCIGMRSSRENDVSIRISRKRKSIRDCSMHIPILALSACGRWSDLLALLHIS